MSDAKVRVIIKRPDEKFGHVTNISTRLENLQKTVEGYIETVSLAHNVTLICNEEGKLRDLEPNFRLGKDFADVIVGTVIVCGTDDDEFTDVPIGMFGWFEILKRYGNLFFGILKR